MEMFASIRPGAQIAGRCENTCAAHGRAAQRSRHSRCSSRCPRGGRGEARRDHIDQAQGGKELAGAAKQLQPTLDEMLIALIAKQEGRRSREKLPPVRAVHRLDRDTSGLMVFARTEAAQKHLEQQFRKHSTRRRYLAIVQGDVKERTIESRLVRDRGDGIRGSTTLPNTGKHSVTHVRPMEKMGDYTLVECRPETGARIRSASTWPRAVIRFVARRFTCSRCSAGRSKTQVGPHDWPYPRWSWRFSTPLQGRLCISSRLCQGI